MRVTATFIDGERKLFDRIIDWDGQLTWSIPEVPKFSMNYDGESRVPETTIFAVREYEHLGGLPNKVEVFGRKKDGLVSWHIDQYFRGPDRNTWKAWQRVLRDADRELHMNMIHLTGTNCWPNQPKLPPYLLLHNETRFITDACENRHRPYMFMFHRRSQGVAVKRIN